MPASIETKVAAGQISRELTRQGRNPWEGGELDVRDLFDDDCEMAMVDKIAEIARRIRSAPFFSEEETELVNIVEEFEYIVEGAENFVTDDEMADEFDGWWDEFYDWCDLSSRVWVRIF